MDLNLYNIQYLEGLFGEPQSVHYTANTEKGIDTSGVAILSYPGFQAVAIGARTVRDSRNIALKEAKATLPRTAV